MMGADNSAPVLNSQLFLSLASPSQSLCHEISPQLARSAAKALQLANRNSQIEMIFENLRRLLRILSWHGSCSLLGNNNKGDGQMTHEFKIAEDMDAHGMGSLRSSLEALATNGSDVLLDLSDVRFIDSSGVGGIVFLFKRLTSARKTLMLKNVSGQPLRLLTHLGMGQLLMSEPLKSAA
jgi:anti-anti-sigma factor